MPLAGRVTVSIRDDETNTFLEEYQVVTAGPKTECWIESKEKSRFSIHTSVTPLDVKEVYALGIKVYVDGQNVGRPLLGEVDKNFNGLSHLPGLQDTENVLKPFTFAKTHFMEDGQIEKSLLNALGTIQVTVQRVRVTRKSQNQTFQQYQKPKSKSINEKAKKALITHSVEYAAPVERIYRTNYWEFKNIDSDDEPLHTFTLKYRSRDILEALDIIPSAHVPHNELEDSASANPSSDEEEEEDTADPAEKIKRLKDKVRQLKRKVKEEPRASPELVDLTQPQMKKRRVVVDLT